jgi:hypothetical protein
LLAIIIYVFWRETTRDESSLVLDTFENMKPDELITAKRFVVARKDKTYIVALLRSLSPRKGFYFLRFKKAQETNAKEIHLPNISTREWGNSLTPAGQTIRGIPIVRFEGACTVPDSAAGRDQGKTVVRYVSGNCVGIFASRYAMSRSFGLVRRIDLTGEFDKEIIAEITGELSKRLRA